MSLAGIDRLINPDSLVRHQLSYGITMACKYLGIREEAAAEYLGMSIKDQYRIFDELFPLVVEKRRRETTGAWLERWRKT